MQLHIILQDRFTSASGNTEIGNKIHKSLAGHKDYVDNNMVLNVSSNTVFPECTLFIAGNDIVDKELLREKAKKAIDIFVDSCWNRNVTEGAK